MRAHYTERLMAQYADAPNAIQRAFDKQVRLFLSDLRHPSLRAKKYDEAANIWQARVTKGWRFYFTIDADSYILLNLVPHPK